MTVSAQISLYPLRQEELSPGIDALRRALEREGLAVQVGPMSTLVVGESIRFFAALQQGFEHAAAGGPVAMVVTVSNACPVGDRGPVDLGDL
jgi:uncharacterized protein YqgV (UPF0045/DUF77 family)